MPRFVNRRHMPVAVSGESGENVTFMPGDYRTEPWFKRFCNENGLTEEPDRPSEQRATKPIMPKPNPPPVVPTLAPPNLEEETQYWERRAGCYMCKQCSQFITGSRHSIESHLLNVHKVNVNQDKPKVVEKAAPVVPVAPVAPVEVPKVIPETPIKIKGVACPICGHTFKTEPAMKAHKTRMHK